MQYRPNSTWLRRLLTTTVAAASMMTTVWAAAIQFSKPVIEIAMPEKEQTNVPKPRAKGIDLSASSQMDAPVVAPPPQLLRAPKRDRDDGEGEVGHHSLLDDPDDFPDAVGRDNARNGKKSFSFSKKPTRSSSSSSGTSQQKNKEKEEQQTQSLLPITDSKWDPRDSDRDEWRRDSALTGRLGKPERNDQKESREKSPYETRDQNESGQAEQADPFNSASSLDSSPFRSKQTPTPAQLERRAAFDELLNSSAGSGRQPASLEPVTTLEPPKPIATLPLPMLGGPASDKGPFTPSEGFNGRPDRVRTPAVTENPMKKFSQPPKPVAPAPVEPAFQSPLMRQPTVHEIPSRRF